MSPNPQETADLVTYIKEILDEKLRFCAVNIEIVNRTSAEQSKS